jgi:hypothetical protein
MPESVVVSLTADESVNHEAAAFLLLEEDSEAKVTMTAFFNG